MALHEPISSGSISSGGRLGLQHISIAIDGPAGAGKSTIAKLVAKKLNYKYINTGIMYRIMAYISNKFDFDLSDISLLTKKYNDLHIKYIDDEHIIYNGKNIINDLRNDANSLLAAQVAQNSEVRKFCVELQRKMSNNNNVVMDGRDIGSVVLPNSKIKIYLWASPEIRAKRRVKQNSELGIKEEYNTILNDIKTRDYNDMNRKISPLIQTKDAIKIDSSHLTINEIVNKIIQMVKELK